ncbi:serine hydrolase domain-containing protein [Streptomyces chrestomyceticus]|uniref:serine hydrolase domain-containing protein n=1 Tax=Streptomyces chrestomyceticus TaxID=68185 RepID=UPI0019D1BCB2|nr:serine hydrolase domain-containing protein [Streptomyces chrestomyceticus]
MIQPAAAAAPGLPEGVPWESAEALLSAAPGASAVAVGLYRRGQRSFLVRGSTARESGVPVEPSTRFEIGSLSKTFTALLFAEQAARGEVDHHDPVARHLPAGTCVPVRGTDITLTHLATHTSGLPRLPPGLLRSDIRRLPTNPYASFTRADVLRSLARTRLRSRPGTRVRYSNFGVGLLGHALCGAADGLPYEDLLAARVLRPLGLHDTSATASPPPDGTQVTGYGHGRPRPPFGIPGLPAAGAVRSSARDLLTVAEALIRPGDADVMGADVMGMGAPGVGAPSDFGLRHAAVTGASPAPLRTALKDVTRPRLALPRTTSRLALIWNIRLRADGSGLYHHSGGTRGCTSFVAFSPRHDTALVALANCAPGLRAPFVQQAYDTVSDLLRTPT